MSNNNFNKQQAQWTDYLPHFNFQIVYQPGKKNMKPDTLIKRFEELPSEKEVWNQNISVVIKPHNIMCLLMDTGPDQGRKPLEALWREHIAADSLPT